MALNDCPCRNHSSRAHLHGRTALVAEFADLGDLRFQPAHYPIFW